MGNVHGLARPPRLVSASTALALSLLFIVVYGLTGWITSVRADVGTWVFDWERRLPFVPSLVLPYMSLDLFFVAAPFLCATRRELGVFRRRMTTAILVAGAMFLLVPLQFAFPRPPAAGWTAAMFELLYGFDRACNLFPSLHVAILMLLAGTYHRHSRGFMRWLIHGWFSLIGLSTVLIYQHHVIDVAGGFALGVLCYYLIPERTTSRRPVINARIGIWYATGAMILAVIAASVRPWGLLLVWPAASMTIVASAYFGLHVDLTRKEGGQLPLTARVVLTPWLLGQQASLLYYRRQASPWNVVAPNVWIGRQLNERKAAEARSLGAAAVLDLTSEFTEAASFLAPPYLNIPILDLTAPTANDLRVAIDFINAHREAGAVYVHCKIGYSRSAAVIGAWLIDAGLAATPGEAIAMIRTARPSLIVRPEALASLDAFSRRSVAINSLAPSLIEVRA
jgi:membrane-associated phospholipid phosphatase/predicted protein tyrosine phosphatase